MRRVISFLNSVVRRVFTAEMTTAELEARLGVRPSASGRITVLALTHNEHDRALLSRMSVRNRWELFLPRSCAEAWNILEKHNAQILLCDRVLPGGHWSDVLQVLISSGQSMYLILISRNVDDRLWYELIRWGGHDLVSTPLDEEMVLRAIRSGWSYWKCAMRKPSIFVNQDH